MIRPGEVSGRPKLVVRYPTDPNNIAALLPPGFSPWGEPTVLLGVYCVPVHGEPEHGISTKIPATFNGVEGWFTLGIGIDQESAIFISQETNGQPKFPCEVTYFRLGNTIEARVDL
jgi:acetoacetate decarboxylase